MLWYNGPIKNAVEEIKSSGIPFLVFIQGDDKLSKKYDTFLNNKAVFNNRKCIAIKITQDSLAYKQFKVIYNVVPVPSVFMIGSNGIPLGVLCHETTSEALHNKINEILDKFKTVTNGKKLEKKEEIKKSSLIEESLPERKIEQNGVARIQFRLPSNEMPSWEFPNEATLRDIRIYLAEKLKIKNNFKLLKTYPRVAFTPEDDNKTLEELNLTPSASLIVIPVQDEAVQAKIKNLITQPNMVTTLVVSIMTPLINIFTNVIGYIRNIFQRTPPDDRTENNVKKMQSDTSVEKRVNKKTSTSNVHGFNFDRDSDSDLDINTDNGNSTQQQ